MSDTRIQYHETDEQNIVLTYSQDVEKHLEVAHAARRDDAEHRTAFGKRREFRHVMHVPNNIWLQVCAKLGIPFGECFDSQHRDRIMAEIKGPEYKAFRVVSDKRI